MNPNVGVVDRMIRILFGTALLVWAIVYPEAPYSYGGWIGLIFLGTGLLGWCALYKLLGISTLTRTDA